MWHKIAPRLAEEFTVVAADIRGYGDSSKPPHTDDHAPYSKRAMARDQVEVMRQLGFERFYLAGHDRGGRVSYRLALDHPERVQKLAVLDIIPTFEAYRRTDMDARVQVLALVLPLPSRPTFRSARSTPRRDVYFERRPTNIFDSRGPRRVLALLPESGHHPRHLRGLPRRHHRRLRARRGGPRQAEDRLPAAGALGQPRVAARAGATS